MSGFTDKLMREGLVSSDAVIDACARVPRIEFVPMKFRDAAHADIPLPLGYGHIMPAPSVVAFMLDRAEIVQDQKVLIAGCGSGWVVALVMDILGAGGEVIAYDMSEALVTNAKKNVETFVPMATVSAHWHVTHGCEPTLKEVLYDRIIVFNARFCPCHLEGQLAPGGVMIAPHGGTISRFSRVGEGSVEKEVFNEVSFLPA